MSANRPGIAVIIVTHNSAAVIGRCLAALGQQTLPPDQVLVVDSGSDDRGYLERIEAEPMVSGVQRYKNIGFARANNAGMPLVGSDIRFVLFLNPDTFLHRDCLARAVDRMAADPGAGIMTGRLCGYDVARGEPTGRLDSTGIFRKWYGRWYDRGQGEEDQGQYLAMESIPAACGAFMFCRKKALQAAALPGGKVFDDDFFLYKEDIELSLRTRKAGWEIRYVPELKAYHGRGWRSSRRDMGRRVRKAAAGSEILLYRKHPSPYIIWAVAKYVLVTVFNI